VRLHWDQDTTPLGSSNSSSSNRNIGDGGSIELLGDCFELMTPRRQRQQMQPVTAPSDVVLLPGAAPSDTVAAAPGTANVPQQQQQYDEPWKHERKSKTPRSGAAGGGLTMAEFFTSSQEEEEEVEEGDETDKAVDVSVADSYNYNDGNNDDGMPTYQIDTAQHKSIPGLPARVRRVDATTAASAAALPGASVTKTSATTPAAAGFGSIAAAGAALAANVDWRLTLRDSWRSELDEKTRSVQEQRALDVQKLKALRAWQPRRGDFVRRVRKKKKKNTDDDDDDEDEEEEQQRSNHYDVDYGAIAAAAAAKDDEKLRKLSSRSLRTAIALEELGVDYFKNSADNMCRRAYREGHQIVSMIAPVLCMVLLVTAYVLGISKPAHERNELIIRHILIYDKRAHDDAGDDSMRTVIGGSVVNACMVVLAILALTMLFICCFLTHLERYLAWLLKFLICVLIAVPWSYFLYQLSTLYALRIDAITFALLAWNFTCVGMFAIVHFSKQRSPPLLNKTYLMLISLSLAWPFMEFDEWSLWFTLVLLTVYDIVAVLTPCGPLRYIVNNPSKFKQDKLPGLMYKDKYFMLGLGDFVFYATLAGRAALKDDLTLITCTLGILFGLAITIVFTNRMNLNALPALPFSIVLGIVFYFGTATTMAPYLESITVSQLFI
jgi:hypothetical protein